MNFFFRLTLANNQDRQQQYICVTNLLFSKLHFIVALQIGEPFDVIDIEHRIALWSNWTYRSDYSSFPKLRRLRSATYFQWHAMRQKRKRIFFVFSFSSFSLDCWLLCPFIFWFVSSNCSSRGNLIVILLACNYLTHPDAIRWLIHMQLRNISMYTTVQISKCA